jgi:hypothetical protein
MIEDLYPTFAGLDNARLATTQQPIPSRGDAQHTARRHNDHITEEELYGPISARTHSDPTACICASARADSGTYRFYLYLDVPVLLIYSTVQYSRDSR